MQIVLLTTQDQNIAFCFFLPTTTIGQDCVTVCVIYFTRNTILTTVVKVINNMLESLLPSEIKLSNMVLLRKINDSKKLGNFRSITL